MKEQQIKLITKLMRNSISKEQFVKEFNCNPVSIKSLLETAYLEKNEDDIDYLFYILFTFNLVTDEYVDLLCRLMDAPWHHNHEDIASIFQSFEFHQGVECLYRAALTQHKYLEYDEAYALAVKCIWALGAINTPDSIKKLQLLTESKNEIIRSNAINQLSRILKA